MSTPALGPTPAEITYQIAHATQDRRPAVLAVGGTFMVLAVIAVALRFWSRRLSGQKIKLDDWSIVLALVAVLFSLFEDSY
jgi:hypothetical protein